MKEKKGKEKDEEGETSEKCLIVLPQLTVRVLKVKRVSYGNRCSSSSSCCRCFYCSVVVAFYVGVLVIVFVSVVAAVVIVVVVAVIVAIIVVEVLVFQ